MHPDAREVVARAAAGLRLLVLVVREHEVAAATVNLKLGAEVRLTHRGALDVPGGASGAPWRVPAGVLAGLGGLPKRKVGGILFAVGALEPLALIGVIEVATGELAVALVGAHAEVDVALGLVGVPAVDQGGGEGDDLGDRAAHARLHIRAAEAKAIGIGDVALVIVSASSAESIPPAWAAA